MIDWLKVHWFLLAAFIAIGTAYGEQRMKIETLEQAVKQQSQIDERVRKQSEDTAKIDERTKIMLEQQKDQQKLLQEILRQTTHR